MEKEFTPHETLQQLLDMQAEEEVGKTQLESLLKNGCIQLQAMCQLLV